MADMTICMPLAVDVPHPPRGWTKDICSKCGREAYLPRGAQQLARANNVDKQCMSCTMDDAVKRGREMM